MAAYNVGTTSMGVRCWWDWRGASFFTHLCTDIRDATSEEAEIMDKVVSHRYTLADCYRLQELIRAK